MRTVKVTWKNGMVVLRKYGGIFELAHLDTSEQIVDLDRSARLLPFEGLCGELSQSLD